MSETNKSLEERKAELVARRAFLVERMERAEKELDQPASKDFEERAVERESDEVLEALEENDHHELQMIDAALHRVEDGTFGFCVKCGDEIRSERLDILPYTPFCSRCAV